MILAKNYDSWVTAITLENGKNIALPQILIPGSDLFNEFINKHIDIKKHYNKMQIRKGSEVRLSDDPNDYFYGFMDGFDDDEIEDRLMYKALGSVQIIKDIFQDGSITFENPNDEDYLKFCDYGVTEIIETITY